MFPRLLRTLCASTIAAALLGLYLLPSGSAQDKSPSGYSKEIKERIKEWESDKNLKPYAYTRTKPDEQTPVVAGSAKDNAIAICIGLNRVNPKFYAGWSGKLGACENDAREMAKLLEAQKFRVIPFLTDSATVENVFGAIRRAAKDLRPGGILVITYSGHGSQVRDLNGDEPDGEDETWCLYDRMTLDDELAALWPLFEENTRILVLSDSCHSGSATKAIKEPEKFVPPENVPGEVKAAMVAEMKRLQRGQPLEPEMRGYVRSVPTDVRRDTLRAKTNKELYAKVGRETPVPSESDKKTKASVLLISGCDDSEVSLEIGAHGLFTNALLEVWKEGKVASYRELREAILAKISKNQTPQLFPSGVKNPAFENQRPFTP